MNDRQKEITRLKDQIDRIDPDAFDDALDFLETYPRGCPQFVMSFTEPSEVEGAEVFFEWSDPTTLPSSWATIVMASDGPSYSLFSPVRGQYVPGRYHWEDARSLPRDLAQHLLKGGRNAN